MKCLNLHCDYIKFKGLKKALKSIEEIAPNQELEGESKDCLVVLTAIEKEDSKDSIEELVKNIKDIAESVKAENIVLYPYAHLSSNLGKPETAIEILNETAKKLKGFKVVQAPFGYYKEFELKVKGHPLSELSREIKIKGNEEKEKDISSEEREKLVKKLTKIKMQAPRGKDDLKSNVELGRDLDLYLVNEVIGQGLPLLTPKGTKIKREIERFIVDEELRRGYVHVSTPIMAKSDLYKISGHWHHYKDDMFVMCVHGEDFALRPMSCPFHFALYKRKPRRISDLPIRYAEIASLFRNEKSGELRGLTRVRQFTLADAHIVCAPEQVESEFLGALDLIKYVMETFGIEVWYRFSKWDPENKRNKYIDNPKAWEHTQDIMKKILDKLKLKYIEAEDEAAFYGPKLDLQYKDVYGKEDTLLTIQIDFSNPERFDLNYTDKDGKEKLPYVIHRSSTGATERIMAYLLEKNQGSLPLWISPNQVKVMSLNDDANDYAMEIKNKLFEEGFQVELDTRSVPMGKKAAEAQSQHFNYLVTVGEKEKKENQISVRTRESRDLTTMSLEDFIKRLKEQIRKRK